MNEVIYKYLLKSLDNSRQAVFLYKVKERNPFLANKIALTCFTDNMGMIDVPHIFEGMGASPFLKETVAEQLLATKSAVLYDVAVNVNTGESKICDMQIAYADEEQEVLSVALFFKEDNRLEVAKSQVNQSTRAEGILQFDQGLSLLYCNQLFRDIFPEVLPEGFEFSQCFLPEIREELQKKIHSKLQEKPTFFTKIKFQHSSGEILWYSMELQRRALDDSGQDKIMVYLANIQEQIEIEEEKADINQYFNILQEMCQGMLYRFDIKTRTLYRNKESMRRYNAPRVTENFPPREWLELVMAPEDIDDFMLYIDTVVEGKEGSHTSLLKNAKGNFEHHKFTFKAVRRADGTIAEMVGTAMNIHNLKETQKQLAEMNRFLHSFQNVSKAMLYRFDIKRRIFYRHGTTGDFYGVPEVAENYPDRENIQKIMHPDDLEEYLDFIEQVVQGKEGSLDSRILTPSGDYCYYRMSFEALLQEDGTIEEMIGAARKVQYLKDTEDQLATTKRHFRAMQELSDSLLFHVDTEIMLFTRYSNNTKEFGLSQEQVPFPQGLLEGNAVHSDDLEQFEFFAQEVQATRSGTVELRMRAQEGGDFRFYQLSWIAVENKEGHINGVLGMLTDVQLLRELESSTNFDPMTHTLNKRALYEEISRILGKSDTSQNHALLFLDLDKFKDVNETKGSDFGDFLLGQLGTRLRDNLRSTDLVGRVGGDQFLILLRDIPSVDILKGRAKMLLSSLSEDFNDGKQRHFLQGKLGISLYPEHGQRYEELYERAGQALQVAKDEAQQLAFYKIPTEA